MYPDSESESAALCGEHDLRLIEEYHRLKGQEQDLAEQRKLVEAEIKRMIGECEELRCGANEVRQLRPPDPHADGEELACFKAVVVK